MGLFILTGSQQFSLMSGISQSLAGRSAFVELLPFSLEELARAGKVPPTADAMLLARCAAPSSSDKSNNTNQLPNMQ